MKALAPRSTRPVEFAPALTGEQDESIRTLPGRPEDQVHSRLPGPALKLGKILVPTDFSNASVATLKCAIALANYFTAEISLLHVAEFDALARGFDSTAVLPSHEDSVEHAARRLERISRRFVPTPHRGETLVRSGEPVRQVMETARWLGINLIVLSTQGPSSIQQMLKPSIAERVVRGAPCPVLTVRQEFLLNGNPSLASAPASWRNILVPVDFTQSSRNALRYAVTLALPARSKLTLFHLAAVHVVCVAPEMVEIPPDHEALRCEAETQLAEWAVADVPKTLAVDTVVQVGAPAGPFVATAAERFTAVLIVQGTHHHTWWERLASDHTAERIVRTGPCPVLSIPE
ncbi:MAG: universal stress protein [Verrucomicrobiales bacterium]|nr:universal stress protein [Verrucomicrobiales bacterium]